ncbi:NUDIX hydrolase [Sphingomicrobium lutaoense]|uniref:8-oxo-dGTP pyrophosphatase MutT (NUDIX family) n=1 Tax=Sphingomicrobium lutaoense TaxID=515949 RepID=A0A839Z613_9SPHN|nr:NUDIX domain-containing protein [Sphingomicrobium lutaoense]MBB3764134.1 8-oxo-dGTP pyrophosphatase MutT (NUDIX family) [Sphingomicrobium lutaoense]
MTQRPVRPAATLILLRETEAGPPEMLMVRRTRAMAFAAGAWVWPGGRVDPEDEEAAEGSPFDDAAFRIAAIRETEEEVGLSLGRNLEALVPFARWLPKFNVERRFDTFFYLARAPEGARVKGLQDEEICEACWTSARAMLDRIEAGEASAIFPTKRNLERIAQFRTLEELFEDAARHPIEPITPWVEKKEGVDHVVIPEGIGYPVTAEPLTSAIRA